MFQDEARFGRILRRAQVLGTLSHAAYVPQAMLTHEYTYAYAAVDACSCFSTRSPSATQMSALLW